MRLTIATVSLAVWTAAAQAPPTNRWVEVRRDAVGARRGNASRYVAEADTFFLWGFFDYDRNLLQEQPLMETPEYDMVAFDPDNRVWRNILPRQREREFARKLPRGSDDQNHVHHADGRREYADGKRPSHEWPRFPSDVETSPGSVSGSRLD